MDSTFGSQIDQQRKRLAGRERNEPAITAHFGRAEEFENKLTHFTIFSRFRSGRVLG